jgi:aminopeptidase
MALQPVCLPFSDWFYIDYGGEMTDIRLEKMARVLADYSIHVQPGDRVLVETTTAAEPLVRSLYKRILELGGHPHLQLSLPDQDEIFMSVANNEQLDFTPVLRKYAADHFDARIRIYAETNTRSGSSMDPVRRSRRGKALSPIQATEMQRTAEGSFRWMSTQYPTEAYAMEAEMSKAEYEDFFYKACYCDEDTPDPVAVWRQIGLKQESMIERFRGHREVRLQGPDVDLTLMITGRKILNSCGTHNLPDGEIYTGPIEDSANGWVRFSFPAVYSGRVVEGVELKFEKGRAVHASATKDQDFLIKTLDTDPGARYLGEFAIGTNYQINHFSKNILFDEKIGGTFHMALGASYPESGGLNHSAIHWDMICDLQRDSEIRVDGEVVYRNGKFVD